MLRLPSARGANRCSIGVQAGLDRGSESRRKAGFWVKGRGFESLSSPLLSLVRWTHLSVAEADQASTDFAFRIRTWGHSEAACPTADARELAGTALGIIFA